LASFKLKKKGKKKGEQKRGQNPLSTSWTQEHDKGGGASASSRPAGIPEVGHHRLRREMVEGGGARPPHWRLAATPSMTQRNQRKRGTMIEIEAWVKP